MDIDNWVNGWSSVLRNQREWTYLVRRVTDTNVEIWEISLHHIPEHDLQSFLLRLSLHSLREFSSHA